MTTPDSEYLRERYGNPSNDRRTVIAVALCAIAIGLFWLVWQSLGLLRPTVSAKAVAMSVKSASEVTVTYNLFAPRGSTVTCTVSAFTEALTEVGVRAVTVGPMVADSQSVTVTLATIQTATVAKVEGCKITPP